MITSAISHATAVLGAVPSKIDPGVKVNWTFFPFMSTLKNATGGVLAVVLVLAVLAMIVSGLVLAWAKISGSGRVSDKGASVLLWVLVGAAIVASASPIIAWVTGIDTGF